MPDEAPRDESTFDEPVMELVATIEGVISEGTWKGSYKVDLGDLDFGEWEYIAVARIPDRDVQKTSARTLAVRNRGKRLRLELQIDPESPTSFDDRVTLTDEAEEYESSLGVVSQGKMHAHAQGMTTVVFEGVVAGRKYTCEVDPGREGRPYRLFQDRAVEEKDLLPPEGDDADAPAQGGR